MRDHTSRGEPAGQDARHRRQRAHLQQVEQGSAQLHARAVQEPRVPGLRDGLVRRPRWRVRTEHRGRTPLSRVGPRVRRAAVVRRAWRRHRDPAPDDAGQHARPPSGHRDRGSAQRADGVALARGQHLCRSVPRHHPGQSRRHHRSPARNRQVRRPPARCADRDPAAVAGAVWQAAVLAVMGGRRGSKSSGRGAYRGRCGHLVRADAERGPADLRALRQLHGAEFPVPPDESDRRRGIREDAHAEVRLGRRSRRHADAVHVADGLLRPSPPRADAVGAEDAQ